MRGYSRVTRHTFRVCRETAPYTCTCIGCKKTFKRKATVEQTENPFNKNEDGSVKTVLEVHRSARAAALAEAEKLEGSEIICRNCEEAPRKALLLEMAAEPAKFFQVEGKFWGSPMHYLAERKQVVEVHGFLDGNRQNYAPENHVSQGYRITAEGLLRASKFKEAA
ncbi:hypothetical protein BAJUN_03220 [Bajunvirus bajun]|uniref:Uncharacterized protein n=1 Tax=Brevundimonas phage vB_BgoS-Bajun TaxID=2948594 RepID=A0A9E7N7R4_9CAUD|nr:hypothetical protein BAJUN_03220 [Brevundimonas phage vB_BgoS-Bajun]